MILIRSLKFFCLSLIASLRPTFHVYAQLFFCLSLSLDSVTAVTDRSQKLNLNFNQFVSMTMCSAESTAADSDPGIGGVAKIEVTRNPNRRSNKPIMEKRRRARINNCLNELKGILLEAMRKDPARHSKLEKADILELTVSHLKALHRQHGHGNSMSTSGSKFRQGFSECVAEVSRFMSIQMGGFDGGTGGRLLSHLNKCMNTPQILTGQGQESDLSVVSHPIISLVPSRLSSGEIAFVVPGNLERSCGSGSENLIIHSNPSFVSKQIQFPLELTVPSSSSSNSSGSSLSPGYQVNSGFGPSHYGPIRHHNLFSPNQPLALVTPKKEAGDGLDPSCWRPWW